MKKLAHESGAAAPCSQLVAWQEGVAVFLSRRLPVQLPTHAQPRLHPAHGVVRLVYKSANELRVGAPLGQTDQVVGIRLSRIRPHVHPSHLGGRGVWDQGQHVLQTLMCESEQPAAERTVPAFHLGRRLFEHQHPRSVLSRRQSSAHGGVARPHHDDVKAVLFGHLFRPPPLQIRAFRLHVGKCNLWPLELGKSQRRTAPTSAPAAGGAARWRGRISPSCVRALPTGRGSSPLTCTVDCRPARRPQRRCTRPFPAGRRRALPRLASPPRPARRNRDRGSRLALFCRGRASVPPAPRTLIERTSSACRRR